MLSGKTSNATYPRCAPGSSPLSIVPVKAESFDAVWMHYEFVGSQLLRQIGNREILCFLSKPRESLTFNSKYSLMTRTNTVINKETKLFKNIFCDINW